jgi:hypothetical protein
MSVTYPFVILNLFQDNSVPQGVMLKHVQHDALGEAVCA